MKRIIFEVLLVLGLGGAGAFGFFTFQKEKASSTQLAELTQQTEGSGKKLEELTAELEKAQKEVPPLQSKALQLEALREALVNGETLRDLEAAYKKEKTLSPERLAGLGALRLLTKGGEDPATVEAFQKALNASDWGSRRNLICASQKALASAGQEVKVLSECLPTGVSKMPLADEGKPAAKAEKSEKTEKADKEEKPEKASKDADKSAEAEAEAKDDKKQVRWAYEGELGPENWGKDFAMCGRGRAQSPVDIRTPFEKTKSTVMPAYQNGPLRIVNNGKTIQVNVAEGSKLRVDSLPYDLLYFQFRRPSEDFVDGKPAAMGVHFFHKNKEGRTAVLAVLLKEGNENPGIKQLWAHVPAKEGPEQLIDGVRFNPGNLLPREMDFWGYDGSLTTPPCTEGVRYFVLKTPVNIAREQIEQFPFKKNTRPVQPLNSRQIIAS
jgi:carbonic anhydrase